MSRRLVATPCASFADAAETEVGRNIIIDVYLMCSSGSDMSYGEYGCRPSDMLCDPDDDIHYKLSVDRIVSQIGRQWREEQAQKRKTT